jgi:hypothetical protein
VTNDFFHPIERVIERSKSISTDHVGPPITWWQLIVRQTIRAWLYFGQVVCILMVYWFVKLVFVRRYKQRENLWIVGFILSGVFFGFLFKNAAYIHDFFMLGFLPGVMLAAVSGGIQLIEDIKRKSKIISCFIIACLFIAHLTLGVRKAIYFEEKERIDLLNGEATVAFFLHKNLNNDDILAGDLSSGYLSDDPEGLNLMPHLAYLTRQPISYIDSVETLGKIRADAGKQNKSVVFVQLSHGPYAGKIKIPDSWVQEVYRFNRGQVVFLKNSVRGEKF